MSGADRRAFQAAMTLKYCQGNARQAEGVFGWGRETVQLGLNEHRTGVICQGAQAAYGGDKLWEEKHPEVAQALWELAESYSQQDPTFRTLLSYTRLTAAEALKQLRTQGFQEDQLPSPSTMAEVLNRNGYRLRKVLKAKPLKKIPETDAIFINIKEKDGNPAEDEHSVDNRLVKRISIDCKATVNIGDYSRGGKTRGDSLAADHDMGCKEKYTPFGIVDEDKGSLYLVFGSSYKTSDFIVDSLMGWWESIPEHERSAMTQIQIKLDNGPESSGVRTQFLKRLVDFVDHTCKIVQLLYYPPYHSKYNPIERCWGILEQHWNGAKLETVEIMLEWAKSTTWKGIQPLVNLSKTVYQKGISLSKVAMRTIEARLERNPILPKWDILIRPI
ncbi:MAG: ISAzo13 family transposase [Methylococcales bacterium]|nr:MAG: ISAzo13 family transposase [Methylococcales bacterium]